MAIKGNLVVDQGADFRTTVSIEDDDGGIIGLTGYTASAQIRKYFNSNSYFSFVTSIDVSNGEVILEMTAAATANITAGRYMYDVYITSGSNVVSRVIEGIITIAPGVTR